MDKTGKADQKTIEEMLSKAGGLIADADDIAAEMEKLAKMQEKKLDEAQEEVSEAYILLGEEQADSGKKE